MTTHTPRGAFHATPPPFAGFPAGTVLDELADAPAPGSVEQLATQVIERLSGLSDQMRQTQSDRRWSEIPEIVNEAGYLSSTVDGSVIDVAPMIGDLVQITNVLVTIPAGATATLQLGPDMTLPLQAGSTALTLSLPVRRLLGQASIRRLTIATPTLNGQALGGAAALILHGVQMAPTGNMAP